MKSTVLKKLTSIFLIICMLTGFVTITASAESKSLLLTFEDVTKAVDAALLIKADGNPAVSTELPAETAKGWWITGGQLKYGYMTSDGAFSSADEASARVYINRKVGGKYTAVISDFKGGKNPDFLWFNCDRETGTGYRLTMNWAGATNNNPPLIRKYSSATDYERLYCDTKFYIDNTEKTLEEWTAAGVTTSYPLRNTGGEKYTLTYDCGEITFTTELTAGEKTYKSVASYTDGEPYASGLIGIGGNTTNFTYIKEISIDYEAMTAALPDFSTNVSSEDVLSIVFSHEVKLDDVESCLKIEDDNGVYTCPLALGDDGKTVTVDISSLLEGDYRMSITDMVSADGFVMDNVAEAFSVTNPVKITPLDVSLPDLSRHLPKNEPLYIEFSEPVDIDALGLAMTITDSEDNAQSCNIADVSETKKSIDISSLTEGSEYTLSIKELTGENGGILNEKTVNFTVAKLFDVKNILPSNNAIINAGEEASFSMELATHYELEKLELYIDDAAISDYSLSDDVYTFKTTLNEIGSHTFVFKAVDEKGNSFESEEQSFYVKEQTQASETSVMELKFEDADKTSEAPLLIKADGNPAVSTELPTETTKGWWIDGEELKYGNMSSAGKFSNQSSNECAKIYSKYSFGKKYTLTVSDVSTAKNQERLWFNYDREKGTGYRVNLNWVGTTDDTLMRYDSSSSAFKTVDAAVQYYIDGDEVTPAQWTGANVTGKYSLRNTGGEKYILNYDNGVIVFSTELTAGGKTYKSVCSYVDSEPYQNGCIGFGGGSVTFTYIQGISVEYASLTAQMPDFTQAISAKTPIRIEFSDEVELDAVKNGLKILHNGQETGECHISLDETSKIASVDISSLTGGNKYTISLEGILGKNGYILNEMKDEFSVIKIFDVKKIFPNENTVVQIDAETQMGIEILSGFGISSVSLAIDDTVYNDYAKEGDVYTFSVVPAVKGYHTFTFNVTDNDGNRYKETRAFYVMEHKAATDGFCSQDGAVLEALPASGSINVSFDYTGGGESVTAVIAFYSAGGELEKLVSKTITLQDGSAVPTAAYELAAEHGYKRAVAYLQSADRTILSPSVELIAE